MSEPTLISVVVPVYNEETNIEPFYAALWEAIAGLDVGFEVIFVDDGSTDQTFELIHDLACQDKRVKALRFSRNFGSHSAMTAGMRYARGDAVVLISVDLQDPPALIGEFIEKWRAGYQVVWGVRQGRDDPWSKKVLANGFYALIRRIAIPDYPPQGMDCGLFDRRVIEAFNHFSEVSRIVPTLLIWTGFRQTLVPYHREARRSGESKWPLAKRIKAAIDIIVSFSYFPIRFMSYLGIFISCISFVYASFLIVRRVVFGLGGSGWPSVMVAILFLGGLQLIMLGILGEYIWRTSEQVRGRPLYILMEEVGFGETKPKEIMREEFTSESHSLPGRQATAQTASGEHQ
jgi:glycosyltransferase involved in cell wall biosynthesis